MLSAKPESEKPQPRTSWWNPHHGAWRSPWALDIGWRWKGEPDEKPRAAKVQPRPLPAKPPRAEPAPMPPADAPASLPAASEQPAELARMEAAALSLEAAMPPAEAAAPEPPSLPPSAVHFAPENPPFSGNGQAVLHPNAEAAAVEMSAFPWATSEPMLNQETAAAESRGWGQPLTDRVLLDQEPAAPQEPPARKHARESPVPLAPRHRAMAMRRSLWPRIAVLGALGLAVSVALWFRSQDEPQRPDEQTLKIDRSPWLDTASLPSMDRLRVLLESVTPLPSGDHASSPPWVWDYPAVADIHRKNGVALANLKDLLEDEDWQPRNRKWFRNDLGSHAGWVSLAVVKQAEAVYVAKRGDELGAFLAAIDLAELARRMQEIHAWPSFYERSFLLHERACQTLAWLLKQTKAGDEQLRTFAADFALWAPSDKVLHAALGEFFLHEKKIMLGPMSGEPEDTLPNAYLRPQSRGLLSSFKPNTTLRLFVDAFRELQDESLRKASDRSAILSDWHPSRIGSNAGGEKYFAKRIAPYLPLVARQDLAEGRQAVVSALFTVRRFMLSYHRRPRMLLNVRQDFRDHDFIDPFTASPLSYDDRTGVLSSAGANLRPDSIQPGDYPLADPNELAVEVGEPP